MIGDPVRRQWDRAGPMFEFDQASEMRISALRILELVERKTRQLQNIDARKPRARFGGKHAPYRDRKRLIESLMSGIRVYCHQHYWRIGKVGGEGAARPDRGVAPHA